MHCTIQPSINEYIMLMHKHDVPCKGHMNHSKAKLAETAYGA